MWRETKETHAGYSISRFEKLEDEMKAYKVTFADGNTLVTSMNADLVEARAYYVGKSFQFGDTDECPRDKMVKGVSVECAHNNIDEYFGKCDDCGADLEQDMLFTASEPPKLATDEADAEKLAYSGRSWPALKESKSFDTERLNASPLFDRRLF